MPAGQCPAAAARETGMEWNGSGPAGEIDKQGVGARGFALAGDRPDLDQSVQTQDLYIY